MYYHYLPLVIFLFPLASSPRMSKTQLYAKDNHIRLSFTEIERSKQVKLLKIYQCQLSVKEIGRATFPPSGRFITITRQKFVIVPFKLFLQNMINQLTWKINAYFVPFLQMQKFYPAFNNSVRKCLFCFQVIQENLFIIFLDLLILIGG